MDVDLHEAHNGLEVVTESMWSLDTIKRKKTKGSSKSGLSSEMRATKHTSLDSLDKKIKPKKTCNLQISRDQNVHQSVLLGLPENSELFYKYNGETLLTGRKQGHGIFCNCCNTEVSASKFEVHAGQTTRKKPYHNIFDSNGVSLHMYATEQIENRCIQIVDKPNGSDLVACVICRSYDFTENGFDDRTAIICDQCEREYHVGCLRESKMADLKELPREEWFCSVDCKKLNRALALSVARGRMVVSASFIDLLRKKSRNDDANGVINQFDVELILIRCKDASEENRLLLTEAVNILHDCFNPITDSSTGMDFIDSMAKGIRMGGWDFSGVYCAILIIDSKVVTTGMFRVLGKQLVELPLVATSRSYQGKGYLQFFFKCFMELLSSLSIEKLVIPAADDVKDMWMDQFGFTKVTPKQLFEYRHTWTAMVTFEGTTCLEKRIPKASKSL